MSRLPTKPTVVVDTREQQPLFAVASEGDKDVKEYVSKKVDAGDYTVDEIPNLVTVERKKHGKELWSNFVLEKDRFMREVERLMKYEHRYIVIEQTYDEFLNPKSWSFINPYQKRFQAMATVEGWLIYLQHAHNIKFIFAGKKNAPRLVRRLLCKHYGYERKRLFKEGLNSEETD